MSLADRGSGRDGSVTFGPFHLHMAERRLEKDGRPLAIGGRALDVLIALAERPGEVVTRRELLARVWAGAAVEEGNLHVQVAALRKLLGEGRGGARYIKTIPGRGYCFVAPVVAVAPPQPPTPQAPAWQAATPHDAAFQAATPQAATPQAATPQAATPQAPALQATTPQAATPQAATLQAPTSDDAAFQAATSQAATSQAATSQAATSQAATSQAATPQAPALQATTQHDAALQAPTSDDAALQASAPHDPQLQAQAMQASPPRDQAPPSGPTPALPALMTRVIGRDDTIRFVTTRLMTWRFVSIVGPGGIGKTTLAVSVAHTLRDQFAGAVFFVDLGALTDAQLVPVAVASVLGLMLQTQDPVRSLLAFIGDRKLLIVLDNCEHVIGPAASLAERVVSAAPQVHVLATSREALRAQGEYVHRLNALACPPQDAGVTAAEALKYPAVQLFMERAAASGFDPQLSDADAPAVSRICHRLDGIALAIELAASRTGVHGIRGIAELLENRFGLRWRGRRTAVPRHQTLNAMLDWSFNLLSEQEQLALCRLSVFIGDFTLEAACAIASDGAGGEQEIVDAVSGLVAKSLMVVRHVDGQTCCRLLDITRTYAADRLAARGETDRIARRHVVFFSDFLQRDDIVQSTFGEHDLSPYAPHIGNVRAGLEWALTGRGDIALGVELAAGAAPLFLGLSLLDECRRWCEQALAVFDDASRGSRSEMILQESLALSSMYTRGSSDALRATLARALAIAEARDDPVRQLHILAGTAMLLLRLGDVRGGLATAQQGGRVAQRTFGRAGLVVSEWIVGACHHFLGDQAAAQSACENGLAHGTQYGVVNASFFGFYHRAGGLVALARALWLRGLSEQALRIARQAIDEEAKRGHPVSVCFSLAYGLSVFLWAGDFVTADALIERLIPYAARYSLLPYRALGIAQRGELALRRGEWASSIDQLRSALEALRGVRHQPLLFFFTGLLAEALRRTGEVGQALTTVDGAIAVVRETGVAFGLAELLRIKAGIHGDMQRRDDAPAMACLTEAIAVARHQSALAFELRAVIDLAGILAGQGRRDRAREELTAVCQRFTEGSDTLDLRTARRVIAELG